MNAPLPEHIRKALETVTLDDYYSLDYGRAFMSVAHALRQFGVGEPAVRLQFIEDGDVELIEGFHDWLFLARIFLILPIAGHRKQRHI